MPRILDPFPIWAYPYLFFESLYVSNPKSFASFNAYSKASSTFLLKGYFSSFSCSMLIDGILHKLAIC
ncbi:Uncharacterised protein [Chlamydia trachomatis]|nr:Uncharacterised protein [Chlamydia trachomatis]